MFRFIEFVNVFRIFKNCSFIMQCMFWNCHVGEIGWIFFYLFTFSAKHLTWYSNRNTCVCHKTYISFWCTYLWFSLDTLSVLSWNWPPQYEWKKLDWGITHHYSTSLILKTSIWIVFILSGISKYNCCFQGIFSLFNFNHWTKALCCFMSEFPTNELISTQLSICIMILDTW